MSQTLYVLCSASGWGASFPVLQRVEAKTAEEVAHENGMARQLQMERYWITLDEARRRFPNNALIRESSNL